MTDAVRRGRPGYDQETVLRRAIDLFNRQGYDATSMGDLARELGLTQVGDLPPRARARSTCWPRASTRRSTR